MVMGITTTTTTMLNYTIERFGHFQDQLMLGWKPIRYTILVF